MVRQDVGETESDKAVRDRRLAAVRAALSRTVVASDAADALTALMDALDRYRRRPNHLLDDA